MLDMKIDTTTRIFSELEAMDATGRAALYASAAKGAAGFLDADGVAGYVALPADEAHLGGVGACGRSYERVGRR
jgi:hypothetical protein